MPALPKRVPCAGDYLVICIVLLKHTFHEFRKFVGLAGHLLKLQAD